MNKNNPPRIIATILVICLVGYGIYYLLPMLISVAVSWISVAVLIFVVALILYVLYRLIRSVGR